MRLYRYVFIFLLFSWCPGKLWASHFYGVDLYYKHIADLTYRVTLVAYGDCSGEQFPSFVATRPRIYIRKGNTDVLTDFLEHEPPANGVEVTPVCPDQLNNTTCVNPAGTVPGVKKFVYSKEFSLSGRASDWKFVFLGEPDGTTIAGRSNSLTNLTGPGVIRLEATLNNADHDNSSPVYTTIATPFYCINRPTNFNPGAVDADGDSLVYELVPGLDRTNTLTYKPGFSGSNPLDVAPGAFSFSSSTGQLTFTPAQIQKSLVVYRVSEYRNGALMGTSMREMTVVVMDCSNNPPAGYITNASGAGIVDKVTVRTCSGSHEVAFEINPADTDGNKIKMEVNGLPKDAKLDITNNNSAHPQSRFVWNVPELPDGDYSFFITYTDDGCPIASRQTQAYTVRLVHEEISCEAIPAGCLTQGIIEVISPTGWSPWSYKISGDHSYVYSRKGVNGTTSWSDSLEAGKYTVDAVSSVGCAATTEVDVPSDCNIVELPNAFSPNGDGNNDVLYIMGGSVQELLLQIYNRWGQVVFETRDRTIGWDGTFNGYAAPIEGYAYVLTGVFRNGEPFEKKGNVTLLR